MNQVESGAKKIPDGKTGDGVEETAKGVGKTVSESAKYGGEKMKEAHARKDLIEDAARMSSRAPCAKAFRCV